MANHYTAEAATEWGIGGGVNGTGKRPKVTGAYTVSPEGRKVRAFRDNQGGLDAAQKWADVLNERIGVSKSACA